MADTKKYKVVTPIGMHGKDYEVGSTIALSDEEAAAMPWAIEPPKAPVAPKDKVEMTEGHRLFLVSKGYQLETIESAQNFFDNLKPKERKELLAEFGEASKN